MEKSTLIIKKGEFNNTYQVGIAESDSEYNESSGDERLNNQPVRVDASAIMAKRPHMGSDIASQQSKRG